MRIVHPDFEILAIYGGPKTIEAAGRTCYKSEDKITSDSAKKFVAMIRDRGHHSVLEHSLLSVKIICDRGVTHEIVRHRLAAYSQESTRYVNYKGGCTFVAPPWTGFLQGEYRLESGLTYRREEGAKIHMDIRDSPADVWLWHMFVCENNYKLLIEQGWSPQEARSVLPNSTKTEIVVTANFREWRHIFTLRCSSDAHPQMREVMYPILTEVQRKVPVIFDDLIWFREKRFTG